MAKTETTEIKPRNDAYVGILFISLLALIGACVLLYLDYNQYEGRVPPKPPSIELPKGSSPGTGVPTKGNTPKVDPPKDPMGTMKLPTTSPTETTSIKPIIELPPAPPATIPMLELPGVPPLPVTSFGDKVIGPAKLEVVSPMKPVEPVSVDEIKPMPIKASEKPLAPPSLLDEPPVIRPFVPSK